MHDLFSCLPPEHFLPPYFSYLIMVLFLWLTPFPQYLEQEDHLPQDDHLQFSGKKMKIFHINNLIYKYYRVLAYHTRTFSLITWCSGLCATYTLLATKFSSCGFCPQSKFITISTTLRTFRPMTPRGPLAIHWNCKKILIWTISQLVNIQYDANKQLRKRTNRQIWMSLGKYMKKV